MSLSVFDQPSRPAVEAMSRATLLIFWSVVKTMENDENTRLMVTKEYGMGIDW